MIMYIIIDIIATSNWLTPFLQLYRTKVLLFSKANYISYIIYVYHYLYKHATIATDEDQALNSTAIANNIMKIYNIIKYDT